MSSSNLIRPADGHAGALTPKNRPETPKKPKDSDSETTAEVLGLNAKLSKIAKFKAVIGQPTIDLDILRKLSWSGIPEDCRAEAWQLLMGYLPCTVERQKQTVARKRQEYIDLVKSCFEPAEGEEVSSARDPAIYHQIHIDVPRTNPAVAMYQNPTIQRSLERILYCWAIRHPASGYVQGINDLVTPFFQVYLSHSLDYDLDTAIFEDIKQETYDAVEADCFWCLTKLLDGIQDNYTVAQPGITRQINRLKELINRIDAPLYSHFSEQGVEFLQFSFRWMNCLLMRELPPKMVIRMWDTYMAESGDGFSDFHIYVCAAFLIRWSEQLKDMDFQNIMMFLQNPPTAEWTENDLALILSEAFLWKETFQNTIK